MKICIVGPAFPLRGGIAAFDERLCVALMENNHEAFIISYSLQYPALLFPGKTQYDPDGKAPANIKIFTILNSINPFSWYKTASFINKNKPDLVIFRFWIPFMGPALGSILRLLQKDIKSLALVDNLIPHEHRPGDRTLTKYFMRGISKYIVMSEEVEKDVLQLKPEAKTKLLRHPIYDLYGLKTDKASSKRSLSIPEHKKVILFFGLIRKYKGLDLLIEAFSMMRHREDIILLVAGEFYEDKNYYFELAQQLHVSDQIIWHDHFIPNDDVKLYFSAADLLGLPYRTATQSGVTQVAFHFEIPVIITDVGGLAEIILDEVNGLVAQPDPISIKTQIENFFENNLSERLTKGMQTEKKKYQWDFFAHELVDFIK